MIKVSPYTVSGFSEKLKNTLTFSDSRILSDQISVQGVVCKVSLYANKYAYITIKEADCYLKLRSPFELSPEEGDHIVFEGVVKIQPVFNDTKFEIMIIGKPVGNWEPTNTPSHYINIQKRTPQSLNEYFQYDSPTKILVIGTKTAIRDVDANFIRDKKRTPLKTVTSQVSNAKKLLETINQEISTHSPLAIAIVRGGDDASFAIWDNAKFVSSLFKIDLPIYLALGHSHRITVADKYADQAFHTPTSFGSALTEQQRILDEKQKKDNSIKWLQQELNKTKDKAADTREEMIKVISQRSMLRLAVGLLAFFSLLSIFYIFASSTNHWPEIFKHLS